MKNGGYGKWVDLTQFVWEVCSLAGKLREDLTVLIVMHSETIRDDFGYSFTRIKTNGRKLEKVVLESLFGTVLLAKRTEDGRYVFETQAKNSTGQNPPWGPLKPLRSTTTWPRYSKPWTNFNRGE